jgi:hypothetical protein
MTDATPAVSPITDGAVRVNGLEQLDTRDGPIETESVIALCRCGRSEYNRSATAPTSRSASPATQPRAACRIGATSRPARP